MVSFSHLTKAAIDNACADYNADALKHLLNSTHFQRPAEAISIQDKLDNVFHSFDNKPNVTGDESSVGSLFQGDTVG